MATTSTRRHGRHFRPLTLAVLRQSAMAPSKKKPGDGCESCALLALQISLTLLTGLTAAASWSVGSGLEWKLLAALFACSTVAIVFRLGWPVPCMILGILAGIALDPAIKGGTIDSQMWETVSCICVGAFIGLLIGVFLDAVR
ncbi:MAG: hypothetical protein JXB62_12730 [Pirellulales bacterium]|nr:hypothetical protein [Pirellulales bacterium]